MMISAKKISVDAAVEAVLSELYGIFTLKEEQKMPQIFFYPLKISFRCTSNWCERDFFFFKSASSINPVAINGKPRDVPNWLNWQ